MFPENNTNSGARRPYARVLRSTYHDSMQDLIQEMYVRLYGYSWYYSNYINFNTTFYSLCIESYHALYQLRVFTTNNPAIIGFDDISHSLEKESTIDIRHFTQCLVLISERQIALSFSIDFWQDLASKLHMYNNHNFMYISVTTTNFVYHIISGIILTDRITQYYNYQ